MNSQLKSRLLPAVLVVMTVLSSAGCDPDRELDKAVAKKGLNRLVTVNDYIEPGALILVEGKDGLYADNIADYVGDKAGISIPLTSADQMAEYKAVLSKYSEDRSVGASAAAKFIQSFLPVDVSASLNIKANVNMDMIEAKVKRLKIPDLIKLVQRPELQPFREAVQSFTKDGKKAFLVYETYRSSALKLTATGGLDISTNITTGEVKPVLAEGKGAFSLKRTSGSELIISGDTFYVFAVRTCQLTVDPKTNQLGVKLGTFGSMGIRDPEATTEISKNPDSRYSAYMRESSDPINDPAGPISLKRLPRN